MGASGGTFAWGGRKKQFYVPYGDRNEIGLYTLTETPVGNKIKLSLPQTGCIPLDANVIPRSVALGDDGTLWLIGIVEDVEQ